MKAFLAKLNINLLLIIIGIICLLVFFAFYFPSCNKPDNSALLKTIDSVKAVNTNLLIENAGDKQKAIDYENENTNLKIQLSNEPQIVTQKTIEYRNSSPQEKAVITSKKVSQMQKEMIREIESAKPRYVVVVNEMSSWYMRPKSDPYIIYWTDKYLIYVKGSYLL